MRRVLLLVGMLMCASPFPAYSGDLSDYVGDNATDFYKNSDFDQISKQCAGKVENIVGLIEFDDPYEVEGKCYAVLMVARFGNNQWLDKNTILINDRTPYQSKVYSTIIHDPKGHLKYGARAIIKGISPKKYQSVMGALVIAPTFEILKYADYSQNITMNHGSVVGKRPSLSYPTNKLEQGISGSVQVSCHMIKESDHLWHANNCSVISSRGGHEFEDSALAYYRASTWGDDEIKGKLDANNNLTNTSVFNAQ